MTEAIIVTEQQITRPLELVLQEVIPKTQDEHLPLKNNSKPIKKSLEALFPEQQYEDKDFQRTKEILGPLAKDLTIVELRDVVAETQFLINSWLDDFERDIFNGLTLNELLHEKGGL